MTDLGNRLRKMGTDIYALGDAVDAGVDVRNPHPLPEQGNVEFPPPPLNEQGSWVDPATGQEYTWINHITSSILGGPATGYWAPVKPLKGASPK